MFGISSLYSQMFNQFSNQSRYYNQTQNTSQMKNNAINTVYDYYDRQLTNKNNAKLEQGLEKVFKRLETQATSIEKQQQALQDTKELSGSLTEKMSALKDSADKLKNTSFSSVLKPLSYGSQNENVAVVQSGAARNNVSINLKVDQLAAKQATHFQALDSSSKDVLSGKSTMQLKMDGKTQTIDFNIAEGATTKEALSTMATSINNAKAGVQASVMEVDGKSILSVMSEKTGKDQSFELSFTGKAETNMKVQSTIDARDAIYSVDGETKTSASNQIQIPTNSSTLTVDLKGKGETVLSQSTMDTSKVVKGMKEFISAYNDAVNFLNDNQKKSSGVAALSQSFSNTRFSADGLQSVGVEVDGKGRLSLNEGKFVEVLKKDPKEIESKIGSYQGLAGMASSKAQSAMILSNTLVSNGMGTYNSSGQAVGFFYNMVV